MINPRRAAKRGGLKLTVVGIGSFWCDGLERRRRTIGGSRLRPGGSPGQATEIREHVRSQGEADLPGDPKQHDRDGQFEERRCHANPFSHNGPHLQTDFTSTRPNLRQRSNPPVTMQTPDPKQTISILNDLIETLKDGELGYQQAGEVTKDADLKTLFAGYAHQRHEYAKVLQKAVYGLGEAKPEHSGSTSAAMHRGWIGLKAALTTENRHAILAECERGEDSAKKAYSDALADPDLSPEFAIIVQEQSAGILAAHNEVKKLRDLAA
jgi:uncharacterized protein (TIGR02284 family)